MHAFFIGQVFRRRQRHARGGDTLNGRVIGQVHKQHRALNRAGALEVADEIVGFLKGDADGSKDHREAGILPQHLGLAGNLCCQLGVR